MVRTRSAGKWLFREESCFIWSIFYSLLVQIIDVLNVAELDERSTEKFNELEYLINQNALDISTLDKIEQGFKDVSPEEFLKLNLPAIYYIRLSLDNLEILYKNIYENQFDNLQFLSSTIDEIKNYIDESTVRSINTINEKFSIIDNILNVQNCISSATEHNINGCIKLYNKNIIKNMPDENSSIQDITKFNQDLCLSTINDLINLIKNNMLVNKTIYEKIQKIESEIAPRLYTTTRSLYIIIRLMVESLGGQLFDINYNTEIQYALKDYEELKKNNKLKEAQKLLDDSYSEFNKLYNKIKKYLITTEEEDGGSKIIASRANACKMAYEICQRFMENFKEVINNFQSNRFRRLPQNMKGIKERFDQMYNSWKGVNEECDSIIQFTNQYIIPFREELKKDNNILAQVDKQYKENNRYSSDIIGDLIAIEDAIGPAPIQQEPVEDTSYSTETQETEQESTTNEIVNKWMVTNNISENYISPIANMLSEGTKDNIYKYITLKTEDGKIINDIEQINEIMENEDIRRYNEAIYVIQDKLRESKIDINLSDDIINMLSDTIYSDTNNIIREQDITNTIYAKILDITAGRYIHDMTNPSTKLNKLLKEILDITFEKDTEEFNIISNIKTLIIGDKTEKIKGIKYYVSRIENMIAKNRTTIYNNIKFLKERLEEIGKQLIELTNSNRKPLKENTRPIEQIAADFIDLSQKFINWLDHSTKPTLYARDVDLKATQEALDNIEKGKKLTTKYCNLFVDLQRMYNRVVKSQKIVDELNKILNELSERERDIIKYYGECSQGLGAEFLNEFERQILRIASMPTRWMVVESDVQRSLMKRFPYVIYFRVLDNDTLRVTVVKHQHRHPDYGRNRR